jgi:hypothetical protein
MIGVIIGTSIFLLILIISIGIFLYYKNEQTKNDIQDKLQGLVNQINKTNFYGYKFDKNQNQILQNTDLNVNELYNIILQLQNNVNYIEENAVLKDDNFISLTVENINKVNRLFPNERQLCLDNICLIKDDLIKLKNTLNP